MKKRTVLIVLLLVVIAAAWSVKAYAAGGDTNAWQGFWNSVGGFLYNALPWNWGNWMGK